MSICLAFDLDDTLYLERDFVRSGFCSVEEWLCSFGDANGFADSAWQLFVDGVRGNIFDLALANYPDLASRVTVQQLVEIYRSHRPSITLLRDASDCLLNLRGTRLALITDGPSRSQERKIEALGIAKFFDLLVITDAWGTSYRKPHPRAYELVQSHFRASERYVYIGDNPAKDFIAPKALGWTTVRVRRPGGLHTNMAETAHQKAHFELSSLYELSSLLVDRTK
jgi:putative hydrolase of the HAD superfamily